MVDLLHRLEQSQRQLASRPPLENLQQLDRHQQAQVESQMDLLPRLDKVDPQQIQMARVPLELPLTMEHLNLVRMEVTPRL